MLERVGLWCARRRWLVLALWLGVVVSGALAAPVVFDRLSTAAQASSGSESSRGFDLLKESATQGPSIVVLVDRAPVRDPAVAQAVEAGAVKAQRVDGVQQVTTAQRLAEQDPKAAYGLIARDQQAQIVDVALQPGLTKDERTRVIEQVEAAFDPIAQEVPRATVQFGGELLVEREINDQVEKDVRRGELIALPLVLLVMILVFQGFVAASLPLLAAFAAIAGAFLTLLGFSRFIDLDQNVLSVTTVLALGLAIDYSLLLVTRFREERGHGWDVHDAIGRASATAGRTVMFSGLTVATALSGLFLFQSTIFRAIGAAGVGVVLVSVLVALTLTPALLGVMGRRVSADARPPEDDGAFYRLATRVQTRPLAWFAGLVAVFALLGLPFLFVQLGNSGVALIPPSFESRQVADQLATRFPGQGVDPVTVVGRTSAAEMTAWAERQAADPGVAEVLPVQQRADGVVAVDIRPTGDGRDATAQQLVRELRAANPPGDAAVTGQAAVAVDFMSEIRDRGPWALLWILGATFLLLFLMTGSVLIPVKAVTMNVLSLSATFGIMVMIFQWGLFSDVLGFTPSGVIETWLPVIVFAFAFGLSMDYEVFLLSRIKELYDQGYSNNDAVRLGLQRSGRVITSAALIMALVFAGFATGEMLGIKQMGVALTTAVIVDATLVRLLLVPATMTLLGDLNWWAPAPLRRLHDRFGLSEHGPADKTVAPPPDATADEDQPTPSEEPVPSR